MRNPISRPTFQFDRSLHVVRRRWYHRISLTVVFSLAFIFMIASLVVHDIYRLRHQVVSSPAGPTYKTVIAGPVTTRSDYFKFTDSSNWLYDPTDSSTNKLTYLLFEKGLPAHSLTVFINKTPTQDDLATTRVLPVSIVYGDSLKEEGDISTTCGSQYAPTDPKRIKLFPLSGTKLMCVPDSPQYTVVVGQVGGDYSLLLRRSNGEMANYTIIYHNLTVDPNPQPFVRIMKTFQSL
jgi:hypothetical protein